MLEDLPVELFAEIMLFLPISSLSTLLRLSHEIYNRTRSGISRAYINDRLTRGPLLVLSTLDRYADPIGLRTSKELQPLAARIRGPLQILFQNTVSCVLPLIYSVTFTRMVLYPKDRVHMAVLKKGDVLEYQPEGRVLVLVFPKNHNGIMKFVTPSNYYPQGTTWSRHDGDAIAILERIMNCTGCTIKVEGRRFASNDFKAWFKAKGIAGRE